MNKEKLRSEFREYLKEAKIQKLNESPVYLGDMDGLQYKEEFKDKVVSNFDEISDKEKSKAKKLFNDYKYIIKDNTFYLFRDTNKLDLFIVFTKKNNTFEVHVIRNLSNEKNLSFKVYRAILDVTNYKEITTGDGLSLANLKAHKNALGAFKIYIRTKDGDTEIEDKWEFDYHMKRNNHDEVFVLKESGQLKHIRENYNGKLDGYLDFYMN